MVTFEMLEGPNKGAVYQADRDEVVLGRLPYCDVVLPQTNISRQHARVVRAGGRYFIEDLNSTNGTFVNGRRIRARTPLQDQDVIRLYTAPLLFRESAPVAAPEGNAASGAAATVSGAPSVPRSDPPAGAASTLPRNVGVNAYDKLRTVLQMYRALGSTLDFDAVLPKILDGLFTFFPQTDRAYILVPDAETGQLIIRADRQKEEGTIMAAPLGPISQSIATRVMSQGEAILNADGLAPDLEMGDSVLDFPIRSMMCAPLIGPLQKPLGIIYLDTSDPRERFHADDLELLLSIAAAAGQALEYARAHEAELRLDRRERELTTARQLQLHFLPQSRPALPGYCFCDYYASAEEVGGDYYGFTPLPAGRLAITLGDVAGKGVTAALLMARLCSEVRYQLVTAPDGCRAVRQLNRELCNPDGEGLFVTFVLCLLDPVRGDLTLVNAGHRAPLCRRRASGALEELGGDVVGLPLGCVATAHYAAFTTRLEPGDVLLMYTDGIDEAMNARGDLYGVSRVRHTVAAGPPDIEALCRWLLEDVKRFHGERPQNDDICLIGIQRL